MVLSRLDVYFLVKELQCLVGNRFQRAYQLPEAVYFQFNKQLFRMSDGQAYLTANRPSFPANPPGFAMFLRKRLVNAHVLSVEQHNFDRVIIFTLEKRQRPTEKQPKPTPLHYQLIVELLPPGNIVLVGKKPIKGGWSEDMILYLLRPENFKDRTLRGGIPYVPPPAPPDFADATLPETVAKSGMDTLVKALAVSAGLGGQYATLVCERAELDPQKEKYTKKDIQKALTVLQEFLTETPHFILEKDSLIVDKKGTTMSEALDIIQEKIVEEKKLKKQKGSIREQQTAQKAGFAKAAEQNQRAGELIYEQYQELTAIMTALKKGETPTSKLFKKFDKKTGTITVDIGEQ